ncbi:mechanosensitive ion channel family protein [Alginatibacterium sediminis]|uniref:Mechanosensitive ion channel family protein n=1 Tax=Alginatibacterium sediminis TaxID=2164068 RepID=A0A420E5V5_9ALTE|nr:mechanosensitive ion channel family protein [Alginatibacterium sediminis]RKF13174.1 mechanosensitive ion channel family protein [Alginatibacterium sediminis]
MEVLLDWIDQRHALLQQSNWLLEIGIVLGMTLFCFILWRVLAGYVSKWTEATRFAWDEIVWFALWKPMNWAIAIIGLSMVAAVFARALESNLMGVIPTIRYVLMSSMLLWAAIRAIKLGEQKLSEQHDPTTVFAVGKLLRFTSIILYLLSVFQSLGFSISGVLAFGGMGGLIVGMAAKDLLSNFFGAIVIYLDKPFKVGDWIRSPDREIEGTVEKIGWRVTQIRTFDKRPLYVPNSIFSTIAVENPSRMSNRRIKETVGLRYADASKMSDVVAQVKQMLSEHEQIDTTQTLIVNFDKYNASSIDFFIYTFTKTTDWVLFHEIKHDVLTKVMKIVEDNDAEFAFPTRSLHLHQAPLDAEAKINE